MINRYIFLFIYRGQNQLIYILGWLEETKHNNRPKKIQTKNLNLKNPIREKNSNL